MIFITFKCVENKNSIAGSALLNLALYKIAYHLLEGNSKVKRPEHNTNDSA